MAENLSLRLDSTTARWACAIAIAALVAAIYAPVRHHEFLDYDDVVYLVWNPALEPASLGNALRLAVERPLGSWIPLTVVSHQLDRKVFGMDAAGPLLGNVALHALGSIVLLFALHRLTGRLAASAWVAAIHAVHPLHVESVAWAIERKGVLSGFWFCALLYCHALRAERPSTARYLAVLACLALGLVSKPMLVTAPFVLLLLDYWPLRRLGRTAILEKLPMFALVALISVVTWRFQDRIGAFTYGTGVPLWARFANALDAIVAYLGDAFWPAGLTAYYPHAGTAIDPIPVAACAVLIAAITAGVWLQRERRPWLLVGWLWYGGMLVPVLGLVQVGMQGRADRYTYLPLIGIALALAFTVDDWLRTPVRRRVAAAVGGAAIAALTAVAMPQVAFWRDSRSLYGRMHAMHPDAAFPELRLGMVEAIDGNIAAAAPHIDRAYQLDPEVGAHAAFQLEFLARFQHERGKPSDAIATARFGLGFAERTGQPDRAQDLRILIRSLERAR